MKLLMSSGRTPEQGAQLYYKDSESYSRETSYCFLNPMDAMEIGVEDGEHVLIESTAGKTVFSVRESPETPEGVAYLPCGPYANFILHEFTHSTGAPDFKGVPVEVTQTELPLQSAWDLMEELGGRRYKIPTGTIIPDLEQGEKVLKNHACPLCGCLCDDIELHIADGIVTDVVNGCLLCAGKFRSHGRMAVPIRREGDDWKETSFDEAIKTAAEMFANAKRPLFYGWSGTSTEAMHIGLEIAEEIGAVMDNCSSECHGPTIMAVQEVGHPGCTLGQVKNRADVLVYWGCNPIAAHPRHLSRYSTYSTGAFRPEGRADRTVIVVDIRESETAKLADIFIQVKPGGDYALFNALRAIVRGERDVIPDTVAGVERSVLFKVADILLNAKFGAFFTGIGLTQSRGKYKNVRAGIELVDELNRHTKYTLTPLRGHWNVDGTNQMFSLAAGYPYAVDYSRGIVHYNPGETSGVDILAKHEADAVMIIGTDLGAHFPRETVAHLARINTVVIDPFISLSTAIAKLHIPVASVGLDAEGTAYRLDGVPIHVRKAFTSGMPSDEVVLTRLLEEIKKIKEERK
ncbi:formylmethanofuran dehydrogenase subunit B [Methanorbis rubei]|uniref:Periplasmic nitrate reductase n=1 Tax=Methanorbis rubei TaxID=3028300 RepID=A0AAE4MFZ6_9EURY|nr:Periplasmic nitrate reductase [Methanocorpusculaceae archaeon Cs1]